MKRLLIYGSFLAFVIVALAYTHGTADAAATCSMDQTSLANLIANYDPPLSTTTTALTISSGTLTFTCSGLGTGNAAHVYVLLNGSSSGTLTTPSLTGPNAFQLTYKPCIPGTGTCNGSTSLWQNTTGSAYKTNSGVNGSNTVPSFSIFIGKQDAFVGTTSDYTGQLFFTFKCGEGGSQVDCTGP